MKKYSLLHYLFFTVIITIIFAVLYAVVQQANRNAANDPQLEMAQQIKIKLEENKPVDDFFTDTLDLSKSLLTFTALCNVQGKPLRSSGLLRNNLPQLPTGVFDYAGKHEKYEVTWQPFTGLRFAIVIMKINSSSAAYVVGGKSLQPAEERMLNLVKIIFLGWLLCIGCVLLYASFKFYINTKFIQN